MIKINFDDDPIGREFLSTPTLEYIKFDEDGEILKDGGGEIITSRRNVESTPLTLNSLLSIKHLDIFVFLIVSILVLVIGFKSLLVSIK